MTEPKFPTEPLISINGRPCNEAESMTIRVALATFLDGLSEDNALGSDSHGIAMREGYLRAGLAIGEKMQTV